MGNTGGQKLMPFSRLSLQEIVDRITSDLQNQITGATSFLRRSVLRVIAKVNAGVFHLLYEYLDYQARQLFVSTADEVGCEAIASEYGIIRKAATEAVGSGTATGTNGITIPAGTQLTSPDDQTYETDADVVIAAGVATVAFTATVAGEDGNDDPGIILTFTSPIPGVSTSLTVDADGIYNGTDIESIESLSERVLARKRFPPQGGASFDYERWALEVSGVTRVWIFSLYAGPGTIGIAFVRDNDVSIIPNASQRADVLAYIIQHTDPSTGALIGCPVTAEPGIQMLVMTELVVNFTIAIYPNTLAVHTIVESNLEDLLLRRGGSGRTVYLSEISEAISLAAGEERHSVTIPAADVTAAATEVHVLGTVTFVDY
jgi:uncharacterized phage protein gp47/JayE